MRKRYTRRHGQGPPVRWKWNVRAEAELRGWEHDIRTGEIPLSVEDASCAEPIPWSRDLDEDPADPTGDDQR